MKNTKLANIVVDKQADAVASLLADGWIDIYDGVQPDSADTPVDKQRHCVSLRFGAPAFLPSAAGVITSHPISSGVAVATANPATWARVFRSDHKTAVMDVSVGTRDANVVLPTTHIVSGVTVTCSSFMHSVAKATPGA